jgi:hypothetical protein
MAFHVHLLRGFPGTRYTVSLAAVTVPVAMRLILAAAETYDSSGAGEIESAPAMLSKPRVEPSEGRYFAGSISIDSKSRMALAYSARFSR